MFEENPEELQQAGLLRRFAAIFYDFLLCIALMMFTTGVYMAVSKAVIGTETYKQLNESGQTINDPLLTSTLFITLFLFFGYFWTRTGQTLGMQVWHLRVQTTDNRHITWLQALMRFMTAFVSIACIGLGYFWAIFDKEGRTWQCIASDTKIVRIPNRRKKAKEASRPEKNSG
jgi:uncharacterized RDD family membrane protein YckC